MNLRPLDPDDLQAARALLEAAGLPTDDLDDATIELVGAFDGAGLLGVVGLQACGGLGLLRSLAVAPAHRDRGIARALCERVIEMAASRSTESLWLLTMSARDYFTRYGFEEVPRDRTPDAIRANAQFASLCPTTSHVMRRWLR